MSERPYTLVAELTYRCPLRCVYCSNPINYAEQRDGLSTEDWTRVFREAEELGVVQLNLSGGEPLLRDDLDALVRAGAEIDLYTNLITSGLPLDRARLATLREAGLSSVQLSFQDAEAESAERIAGRVSFEQKLEVAAWVKELHLPLTLNFVLHRQNLDRVEEIVAMAEQLGAERLELANTQYLAWALVNRDALLPTKEQLDTARDAAARARARLKGQMEVLFVLPDYFSDVPKACMHGWGRQYVVVAPDGVAMPCHLARSIPGLHFENVREQSLGAIWESSGVFNAFRGEAWMADPCKSCDRRTIDYGGCRCQAFALTGNAAATDPACKLSPDHGLIETAREQVEREPLVSLGLRYRGPGARR